MVTAYIVILCVSAALASFAALRVGGTLQSLLGLKGQLPVGLFAAVSALVFLTVVGMPAMLLVGAMLLLAAGIVAGTRYLPPVATFGVPIIAVALGLATVTLPAIGSIPPLLVVAGAALGWFALVQSSTYLPQAARQGSLALLVVMAPFLLAPLLFSVPSFLALDALIISAALLGVLLVRGPSGPLGAARAPFAHLLGWLLLEAAILGAWPVAAASLLAWAGAIAYASTNPSMPEPHVPSL